LFNLKPIDPGVNNGRGNLAFGYPDPDHPNYVGPGYYAEAPLASRDSLRWLPPEFDRGSIARAMFYMATRYNGQGTEPNLYLTDDPPSASPWGTEMGDLSVFVQWNRKHRPDELELRRNRLIFEEFQHNRNPFIDFPELVDAAFTSHLYLAPGTWRVKHFSFDELMNEAVSGWLADPDGDGIINLHEYAFGLHPREAGAVQPVHFSLTEGGDAAVEFRKIRDAHLAGLEYLLEHSSDLGIWEPILPSSTLTWDDGPWHRMVRIAFPLPQNAQRQFVRARVIVE
jgi:hypothetical protein